MLVRLLYKHGIRMDEKIIKYYKGDLTQTEEADLLREAFSDPELKSRMIGYQHLHSFIALSPEAIDRESGRSKYHSFAKRLVFLNRRKQLFSLMRYAAVAVVFVLSTWAITYEYFTGTTTDWVAAQQELYVPAGQRARLTLPDGSKVWLNAGSHLSYPSVFGKERKVYLSGEGFFEVAKNEKVPFIVSTNTLDVKALGTQFNVFSYPEAGYSSVYLLEGSVKAYYPTSELSGVILEPNQYLVQREGQLSLETTEPDYLLWREGIYTFNQQKLGDIIEKLKLYYDVNIVVKDNEILNYEYTGKFRQRDGVLEILRVIQVIHAFKISKDEKLNQIVLTK